VALTGGIATGKSVVARVLEAHGCHVHSADRIAHELMKPGRPAWRQIVAHFGPRILNHNRTINRSALGAIIFAAERERRFLNQIVHPLVMKEKRLAIRRLEKKGTRRIFVSEAALTIESGFAPFFDKVIVVHCPQSIQVKRLQERDRITRREALRKIRSQMPSALKAERADYLIDTSGTLEETVAQAERVYRRLAANYRQKRAG
jgi:dephospho-CoA kinase